MEEALKSNAEPQKKPRMVAEVKPMRPSYSDVLTKAVPAPVITPLKPKLENPAKKAPGKGSKSKSKPATLKRQNSSGSDEHNSPKIQASAKKSSEKGKAHLSRKWVSLDNLASSESADLNGFDRVDKFEKKKSAKQGKKSGEKTEALGGLKSNQAKAPKKSVPQVGGSGGGNTVNNFSQTVAPEKVEKSQQQSNGRLGKGEEKKAKEKGSKRAQEKQQRKGQKSRRRENREAMIKDFFKVVGKHVAEWSKIGLKIVFWLLHLISDVVSMSFNLVFQLWVLGEGKRNFRLKYQKKETIFHLQ